MAFDKYEPKCNKAEFFKKITNQIVIYKSLFAWRKWPPLKPKNFDLDLFHLKERVGKEISGLHSASKHELQKRGNAMGLPLFCFFWKISYNIMNRWEKKQCDREICVYIFLLVVLEKSHGKKHTHPSVVNRFRCSDGIKRCH